MNVIGPALFSVFSRFAFSYLKLNFLNSTGIMVAPGYSCRTSCPTFRFRKELPDAAITSFYLIRKCKGKKTSSLDFTFET